jgi:hypothetical protein
MKPAGRPHDQISGLRSGGLGYFEPTIHKGRDPVPEAGNFGLMLSESAPVILLGVILLVIGLVANISILWTIGIVLVVIGLVLALVGRTGRKVGGRAHWF